MLSVCGFEAIIRDSIVDCKVFISPFDDSVRSIIGWLKGFTNSIMPDETWVAVDKPSMRLLFCWVGQGGRGRIVCEF